MNYLIKIKEGLGDIKFDMTIDEVTDLMGKADGVETIDNAVDEMTTLLHYCDGALTLFFEGDEPVLQCIDISADDTTLFNKKIFDCGEKEIVQLMVDNGYFEQDADQEDWGERRISFNEGNIDFFFEEDELIAIVYGK